MAPGASIWAGPAADGSGGAAERGRAAVEVDVGGDVAAVVHQVKDEERDQKCGGGSKKEETGPWSAAGRPHRGYFRGRYERSGPQTVVGVGVDGWRVGASSSGTIEGDAVPACYRVAHTNQPRRTKARRQSHPAMAGSVPGHPGSWPRSWIRLGDILGRCVSSDRSARRAVSPGLQPQKSKAASRSRSFFGFSS